MRVMLNEAKHRIYESWITLGPKNILRVCVRSLSRGCGIGMT